MRHMKDAAIATFFKKGETVVNINCAAIDRGVESVAKIDVPAEWSSLSDEVKPADENLPEYVKNMLIPVNNL